jgi:hypothetical protein
MKQHIILQEINNMGLMNMLGKYGTQNAFSGGLRGAAGMGAIFARDALTGLKSGYSAAARRTIYGGAAGAAYGAVSNDTSIIGGAMMGAGAARYGGAAIRRGRLGARGIGVANRGIGGAITGALKGAWNMTRGDTRLVSNHAINAIRGLSSRVRR